MRPYFQVRVVVCRGMMFPRGPMFLCSLEAHLEDLGSGRSTKTSTSVTMQSGIGAASCMLKWRRVAAVAAAAQAAAVAAAAQAAAVAVEAAA